MALSFEGRVALVTGAGAGLGLAYARFLAARGACVMLNDIGADGQGRARSDVAAADIRAQGFTAASHVGSVAEESAAIAMVELAHERFGRLDILINNAGNTIGGPLWERSTAEFRNVLDVHVMGAFWTMRAALPHMRAQGFGRIVNTTSALGAFGMPMSAAYSTAKAAIIGLTRAASQEHPEHDIRINAVAPIAFTALATRFFDSRPELDRALFSEDRIAPVVAYLVHADCRINGQILSTAAGRVARIFTATAPGWDAGVPMDDEIDDAIETILSTDGYIIPATVMDEFALFAR